MSKLDERRRTSALNGQLGGRPTASTTLQTQMLRTKLQQYLDQHLPEMFDAQIEKAKNGDTQAFIALLDRAHGKPAQALTGADGRELFPSSEEKEKANKTLLAYLNR